ncbi:glycerophosphodiester phosphodiesterase [Singulisphaera acidiphila]|uniref:Glycerophosphoryl diester phosphodiesterase n=1 Tax=Singulisphaera acidiphila (strain ATCC BAA-1392 / DSM 18658 / VKM B-2454 / MOB10) TaxID=886293 RepID=L0DLI5_SINAD|nr:glycerophosphodiester phosphodiesterase [Singulisphaera acidiphila]AGA29526.1 glycerophosphoryl diester phosphodiesterase [Singulisphaera acidiphila DSM 18658]
MVWYSGLLMLLLAGSAPVELIAHRGESADAPENTLAAFRLAWERKVPAIELDVHLSKDGTLVVCHDADTKRTTGVSKKIKESDWDELRTLDAGSWKGSKWSAEKLPRLEEALATIPSGARCFIEVKVGAEAIPALVKAVRQSGKKPEQLAVISFQADAVAESKRQLPELKAFYLASFKQDKETKAWTPSVEDLIAKAKSIKADGLDLAAKGPLDRQLAQKIKKDAGLELYVWTVDDPTEARRMIDAGVGAITTNKAEWLKQQLGQ